MPSLKLEDFSDPELLYRLEDLADDNGLVSSTTLAEGLGVTGLKNPKQNVAVRLGWLKKYGVVRRDEGSGMWGLTEAGDALLHSKLRAAELRFLEGLTPEQLLVVMGHMGAATRRAGPTAATMATRSWRHSEATRKRGSQ